MCRKCLEFHGYYNTSALLNVYLSINEVCFLGFAAKSISRNDKHIRVFLLFLEVSNRISSIAKGAITVIAIVIDYNIIIITTF